MHEPVQPASPTGSPAFSQAPGKTPIAEQVGVEHRQAAADVDRDHVPVALVACQVARLSTVPAAAAATWRSLRIPTSIPEVHPSPARAEAVGDRAVRRPLELDRGTVEPLGVRQVLGEGAVGDGTGRGSEAEHDEERGASRSETPH